MPNMQSANWDFISSRFCNWNFGCLKINVRSRFPDFTWRFYRWHRKPRLDLLQCSDIVKDKFLKSSLPKLYESSIQLHTFAHGFFAFWTTYLYEKIKSLLILSSSKLRPQLEAIISKKYCYLIHMSHNYNVKCHYVIYLYMAVTVHF